MRHIGLIALLGGCFYVPAVNQRPGLEIRSNGATLVRGGTATFEAVVVDPESDPVNLQWRAYLCRGPAPVDPGEFGDCDEAPFFDGIGTEFTIPFIDPVTRDTGDVTTGIRVTLDGQDARGASAKPAQRIAIAVENAPPTLDLENTPSEYQNTVGTPIEVYAAYGDVDDGAAGVTLAWEVFAPSEVPFDPPTPIPNPPPAPNPGDLQAGISFVPTVEGVWQIKVTASDPTGTSTELVQTVGVNPDRAPCITAEVPAIADGNTLPVFEPTLFSAGVDDNLDPWPSTSSDELFGRALFTWSVKVGAGPREVVVETAEQNSFAFDPAAYPVGTIVELRAEIEDRIERTLECDDSAASCAVVTGSGCFQRRTWRVEAR